MRDALGVAYLDLVCRLLHRVSGRLHETEYAHPFAMLARYFQLVKPICLELESPEVHE